MANASTRAASALTKLWISAGPSALTLQLDGAAFDRRLVRRLLEFSREQRRDL